MTSRRATWISCFDLGVDGTGGVVEEEDPRVAEQCPGEGDPLALAAGQRESPLADHRVVAVGSALDESCAPARAGGGLDLVVGGVGAAEGDVRGTEAENRKLSSKTTPIWRRSDALVTSRTSWPSNRTAPELAS